MFKFIFSKKQTISRNTNSYPISLSDVKDKSFYFSENASDSSQDDYINNIVIPNVILNWEKETKYLILDQTIKAFVPSLQYINSQNLEIELNSLNIRELSDIIYYPENWNESDAKTTLTSSYYISTSEIDTTPIKIRMKKAYTPLILFPISNNLQIQYSAGFESNDFTELSNEIKDCLAMQASVIIDAKNGYCEDFYSNIIYETYNDYSIDKQLVSFI